MKLYKEAAMRPKKNCNISHEGTVQSGCRRHCHRLDPQLNGTMDVTWYEEWSCARYPRPGSADCTESRLEMLQKYF